MTTTATQPRTAGIGHSPLRVRNEFAVDSPYRFTAATMRPGRGDGC